MKNKVWKKLLSLCLVGTMAATVLAGCGSSSSATSAEEAPAAEASAEKASAEEASSAEEAPAEDGKPDTWIADREIVIQTYVNDVGYNLPANGMENTLVGKEIKERTGITAKFQYTPGSDGDREVLMAQLASGNIPDVIYGYMNNSSRPEFSIVEKAAEEGVFADLSEYIKDTEIWSKYLEEGFLGRDASSYLNDPKWDGAIYFLPLDVLLEDPMNDAEWDPEDDYRGGMYIRADIAADLGIEDTTQINTQEKFYDLLVQIKNGNYTDANGQPIYPVGPRIWGGHMDAWELVTDGLRFGTSNYFGVTEDGEVLHEVETDAVTDIITYCRKLVAEGLLHPEFFSMDEARCKELAANKSVAIVASTHNYMEHVYKTEDWIPLGPLTKDGGTAYSRFSGERTQYGFIAISAEAENPEEIMQFLDYLSTYEGQLLVKYGIEGESYEMVDGYPQLTEKARTAMQEEDKDYLVEELGARLSSGPEAFDFMLTCEYNEYYFGEKRLGQNGTEDGGADAEYARAYEIAEQYPMEKKANPGLDVNAWLNKFEDQDLITEFNLVEDTYTDMVAKAIYAESEAEAVKMVETFRSQLEASGLKEIDAYLTEIYAEDPDQIAFTNNDD